MQVAGKGVRSLARIQAAILAQSRAYAAAAQTAVAKTDESAFMRFGTPVPVPYNYTNLLGSIPGTQVSLSMALYGCVLSGTCSQIPNVAVRLVLGLRYCFLGIY